MHNILTLICIHKFCSSVLSPHLFQLLACFFNKAPYYSHHDQMMSKFPISATIPRAWKVYPTYTTLNTKPIIQHDKYLDYHGPTAPNSSPRPLYLQFVGIQHFKAIVTYYMSCFCYFFFPFLLHSTFSFLQYTLWCNFPYSVFIGRFSLFLLWLHRVCLTISSTLYSPSSPLYFLSPFLSQNISSELIFSNSYNHSLTPTSIPIFYSQTHFTHWKFSQFTPVQWIYIKGLHLCSYINIVTLVTKNPQLRPCLFRGVNSQRVSAYCSPKTVTMLRW